MELLYDKNDEYREYSVSKYTIGSTFSKQKRLFLPYIRKYEKLTEEELIHIFQYCKRRKMDCFRFV